MEEESINTGIRSVQTLSFNINETLEVSLDQAMVSFGVDMKFSKEDIWYDIVIHYHFINKETNESFLWGAVLTRFIIENLKSLLNEDNIIAFPGNTLSMLFGIAFTHARALVARDIAATKFKEFILPIMNPEKLLDDLIKQQSLNLKANVEQAK